MANTTIATGDAITRKAWAHKWWIESMRETYFKNQGFIGKDPDRYPIVLLEELEKGKGDKVTYGHFRRLTGAGITGDSTLEGNEEALAHYEDDVTIDQVRNAVRLNGRMTEQRSAATNLRSAAKRQLKTWRAEKQDADVFTALSTSPTKVYYGGDATSTATIESGDYMTLALISKVKVYAKKATPRIYPVPIKGKKYYVMVMAPDCAYDLKTQDSTWAQAQREAQTRGDENPLFKGALGVWDGVILHDHEDISVATNWGSGANLAGAINLFLGVQAGVLAYAKGKESWFEKEFDYNNQTGFAVGSIHGVSKTVFNSADNAVVAVETFRSNIS